MLIWGRRTVPSGKTKPARAPLRRARSLRPPASASRPRRNLKLKRRLLEISDLMAAGALLGGDQSTYMPRGGASARARHGATLSKLAHEKSVDPALGKLLDELAPFAAGLPYQSDEASLIRVTRRDFEKAIKVPSAFVVRASTLGSASYDAWTRARPANDFATMRPFLEQAVDLSREYAGFFAPYHHVADPLIDAAEEGMTATGPGALRPTSCAQARHLECVDIQFLCPHHRGKDGAASDDKRTRRRRDTHKQLASRRFRPLAKHRPGLNK
jgi:hypothetical protein